MIGAESAACSEVFSVVLIGILLLAAEVVDEDYGGDRH